MASQTAEAERRQLTVMFCDVVESTTLSGKLDPEDLRHVIRAYQTTCTHVIQEFDGYVAQLLGDGLLVYLGYPQAHEDDAQRAIRAGLGMLAAMEGLNARLERQHGICLALRIGIHTGLVVVGDMGGADRPEQLALGETPNVAARVQGVAEPNTLVITDVTYRLTQGYFECESLGEHHLRGVAQPLHLYHVVRESRARSRLDVTTPQGLTPLVGRESELQLLFDHWRLVQDRAGQIVLLSGEAGIGRGHQLLRTLQTRIYDQLPRGKS
jgi:class 3 adenylate cyclase